MIELIDVVCRRGERDLFAPLTGCLNEGQYVEVVGPNGAGKTTLLRALVGLHSQFSGTITRRSTADGVDLVYQGHSLGLDELLTPLENLRWFAALDGDLPTMDDLADLLQSVGMHAYGMTALQRLSQGQRRRVAMARWRQSRAPLWVLDEPLTALDSDGQALLVDMIEHHCASGGAVVCATHTALPIKQAEAHAWQVAPELFEGAR